MLKDGLVLIWELDKNLGLTLISISSGGSTKKLAGTVQMGP